MYVIIENLIDLQKFVYRIQ